MNNREFPDEATFQAHGPVRAFTLRQLICAERHPEPDLTHTRMHL